eukprot:2993781-Alexandrium_andersonii.AAC.1
MACWPMPISATSWPMHHPHQQDGRGGVEGAAGVLAPLLRVAEVAAPAAQGGRLAPKVSAGGFARVGAADQQ